MPREFARGMPRLGRRQMAGLWDRLGPPRHCGHPGTPVGPAPWGPNTIWECTRCCASWTVPPDAPEGYDGGLGF